MPARKSNGAGPSRKAVQEALEALEYVDANIYATGAMRHVRAEYAQKSDRRKLLQAFLAADLELEPFDPPGEDEDPLTRDEAFAAFLVLLVGRALVAEGVSEQLARPSSQEAFEQALRLATVLGLEVPTDPEHVRSGMPGLVATHLEQLEHGEAGVWLVCASLLRLTGGTLEVYLDVLLRQDHPKLALVAATALLFPLHESAHARLREWLAAHGGANGAWLLHSLGAGPAPVLKPTKAFQQALPLSWPVHEAYMSVPDGSGSQGLVITRKRPDKTFAYFSAVLSDVRGVSMGASVADVPPKEYKALLAVTRMGAGELVKVPVADALAHLEAGLAQAEALGMPVPIAVSGWLYLLAGLESGPLPDARVLAAEWMEPDAVYEAHKLLKEQFARSWFFDPWPRTAKYFEQAVEILRESQSPLMPGAYTAQGMIALNTLIEQWLDVIFDQEERRLWQGRFAETARLMDVAKDQRRRTLAAAAAWAIAPGSDVPLVEQPLAYEMLRQSAFAALEDEEQLEDDLDLSWLESLLKQK